MRDIVDRLTPQIPAEPSYRSLVNGAKIRAGRLRASLERLDPSHQLVRIETEAFRTSLVSECAERDYVIDIEVVQTSIARPFALALFEATVDLLCLHAVPRARTTPVVRLDDDAKTATITVTYESRSTQFEHECAVGDAVGTLRVFGGDVTAALDHGVESFRLVVPSPA